MSVDPKRAMQLIGEQALQIALLRDQVAALSAMVDRLSKQGAS